SGDGGSDGLRTDDGLLPDQLHDGGPRVRRPARSGPTRPHLAFLDGADRADEPAPSDRPRHPRPPALPAPEPGRPGGAELCWRPGAPAGSPRPTVSERAGRAPRRGPAPARLRDAARPPRGPRLGRRARPRQPGRPPGPHAGDAADRELELRALL